MKMNTDREIFHITHVDNLPSIMEAGRLFCDRDVLDRECVAVRIGYDHIKHRRLHKPVPCYPGTRVGDYVPFYFCPRSVMLYVIKSRAPELRFQSGQTNIIHLVSTIGAAIKDAKDRPWIYSDGNAGAGYTQFYRDLHQMDEVVDWEAVESRDWGDPAVKEKKQAEFLVHEYLSWSCFHEIGVFNKKVAQHVRRMVESFASHEPAVSIRPDWYY